MNLTLVGITVFVVFGVIAAVFIWALVRAASDADRQFESYLRKNPPEERDPFDRPHGEM